MLGVEYGYLNTVKSLRWWDARLSLEVWEAGRSRAAKHLAAQSPSLHPGREEKDFDWKLKTKGFTVLGEFSTTNRILNAVTKAKTVYVQLYFYIIPQISQSVAWPESAPVSPGNAGGGAAEGHRALLLSALRGRRIGWPPQKVLTLFKINSWIP